jgi:AcrR family transcriptional regulator
MKEQLKQGRKTQYTRTVLRDSLVELMREKPVTKITIKELCEKADINRTTFYTHYRDQYELLRQIEDETLAYFEEMLKKYNDKYSTDEVTQMVEELFQYVSNNHNSIQVLLSENGDINFQKKAFHFFIHHEQVMKYFPDKTLNSETKEYLSVFAVNGAVGLMQHWLKSNMHLPVRELAKLLIKMIQ